MVKSIAGLYATAPLRDRRFSNRTIDALIAHSIDASERLLFATEAKLKNILGIGQASFAEIMRYRARGAKRAR